MQTVLRFQPIERRGVAAIGIHNGRGYTEENRPDHIDVSRSDQNKILVGPALEKISGAMKDAIKDIPVARKMKDPSHDLVMAECLLSASPEFFQTKGATEKWTRKSVAWLKSEFGDKLLSAVLHMDEQTPHIHAVIRVDEKKQRVHPVTKELMPARRMLCYSEKFMDRKEVLTRARIEGRSHLDTKMGLFQTRYADAVSSLGLSRGRESARTQEKDLKHTSTQEWRDMQQLRAEVKKLEREQSKLQRTASVLSDNIVALKSEELAVEKKLATLSSEVDSVRSELVHVQAEREQLVKKLAAEKAGFKQSVETLEKDAVEKIKVYVVEVDKLEKKIESLKTDYRQTSELVEAQKVELSKITDELKEREAEVRQSEKKLGQLTVEAEGVEKKISDKEAVLENLEAQIKDRKTNLTASKKEHDELLARVKNLTEVGHKWEAYIAQLQKQDMPRSVWGHLVKAQGIDKAREYVLTLQENEVAKIGRQVDQEEGFVRSWKKHHPEPEPEPVIEQQPTQSYSHHRRR